MRDGIIIIINETKKALKEQLRSFRARYTIIPRYHPHWKMITLNSFSHSMCVTCTDVLTYLHTGHHNDPNIPDSFDLKAWIDEWKNINGLDDVDLRADVVLPNLQEKISEFKDNVKEWWGLNVELPVRNKLTTTLEDVSWKGPAPPA